MGEAARSETSERTSRGEAGGAERVSRRHAPWVKEAILAGQRYHWRTKNRLAHNARNIGALATLLAAIGALAWWGTFAHPWLYVPVAAFGFGLLYFATFVLVVHEASHEMFVLAADRALSKRLNRAFGWSVAIFFATHYGKHWERGHLEHHVRPLEPGDPQSHNVLLGRKLLTRVLCNVFIPGFLFLDRTVLRTKRPGGKSSSSKGVIVLFVLLWASVLTAAGLTLGAPVALALFLGIHVITGFNHVKGALEHGGPIGHEDDPFLRSRTTLFFGRRLLMPFHISLHFEHHLNFCVPWYDLPRYHEDLKAIVPPAVWREMVHDRPLRQLSGELGGLSEAARPHARPAQPA